MKMPIGISFGNTKASSLEMPPELFLENAEPGRP